MAKQNSNASGILLFAKQSGITSFSSLNVVKKALSTSKVGHTGTLDSFAQGLLVVCVGKLTRLASLITSFDKTYEAVIEFAKETDTLDSTGSVIKTADFPKLKTLLNALEKFSGTIEQIPPAFSAIHVNGKRASNLARSGNTVELKKRSVQILNKEIIELKFDDGFSISFDDKKKKFDFIKSEENLERKVHYARILFEVSKGTYIRCLARDIGFACKSCAYLVGLLRTKIGKFELKNACGVELLLPFTIDNVLKNLNSIPTFDKLDILVQKIKDNLFLMSPQIAKQCGFESIKLKQEYQQDFYNGRPLKEKMFDTIFSDGKYFVFCQDFKFAGVIRFENKNIYYEYVIPV